MFGQAGFELTPSVANLPLGSIAQLVERRTGIPKVSVQFPLGPTIFPLASQYTVHVGSSCLRIGYSMQSFRKQLFIANIYILAMLETLDHTIRIGSTPTFLYFDLYIYIYICCIILNSRFQ